MEVKQKNNQKKIKNVSEADESSNEDLDDKKWLHLQTFGVFWLSFPDGSRISVCMDHARQVPDVGEESSERALVLGDGNVGVRLTYVTALSRRITVMSDGSVVQSDTVSEHGPVYGKPVPGGQDDAEISRTVTTGGVIIRELLSGRREILHHDGTFCWRNPHVHELAARAASARGSHRDLLQSILKEYREDRFIFNDVPPSDELVLGLPGHWIVVQPSGKRFGRMPMEVLISEEKAAAEAKEMAKGLDGSQVGSQAGSPQKTPDPSDSGDNLNPIERWMEWLGEYDPQLVEGFLEYQLSHASCQIFTDPHTRQHVAISEHAVQYYEEEDGKQHVALFGDSTRMVWRKTENGSEISLESPRRVTVQVSRHTDAYVPKSKLKLFCLGGVILEVVPQEVNEKGELQQADPRSTKPVRNAAVLLRHPDGHLVRSVGLGVVDVISRSEVRRKGGEREAQKAVDRDGIYSAECARDVITTMDDEGNAFEISSSAVDIKLAVSISGDEQLPSPRCENPKKPYLHPDAGFLPLPTAFPEPRLFVVYGDGRAEELLSEQTALDIIRSSQNDQRNSVEVTELQPPSCGVRAHTLHLAGTPAARESAPAPPNPCAGLQQPEEPKANYTVVRHLEEFAPVTKDLWSDFTAAYQRFKTWEQDHAEAHARMGGDV